EDWLHFQCPDDPAVSHYAHPVCAKSKKRFFRKDSSDSVSLFESWIQSCPRQTPSGRSANCRAVIIEDNEKIGESACSMRIINGLGKRKVRRTVRPLQKGFELSDLLHSPGFVSTPPRIVDRIAS